MFFSKTNLWQLGKGFSRSFDQKNFTGYMFNIKLEEKSYKVSVKALLVKIQRSKNRQGGAQCAFFLFSASFPLNTTE